MRVIIHSDEYYPTCAACALRMRVFADVFMKLGHEVTVIASSANKASGVFQEQKERIIYSPTVRMKKKTTLMRLINNLSFAFTSVFAAAKAGKADVVITTSPPALIGISGWLIAKFKGAKLIYDVRDIWPDVAWEMGSFDRTSLYSRVFEFVRNFMLKHADLVTTVSPGKVAKLSGYAPQAEVAFITNGLDEKFLENENRPEIAEKFGMAGQFNCVYIGNLGWAQGLGQLMQLAKRAKQQGVNARFLLFGSGVEEASLKDYAQHNELDNVVFAGRLPNADMYTVLNNAQLSFVSLVNENLKDSVPTKMFEAIGVGCPVLLSAVGDAADILNECQLGIAVRPNDDAALWSAFEQMVNSTEQFKANAEHAKQVILEKYSRQKAAALLADEMTKL